MLKQISPIVVALCCLFVLPTLASPQDHNTKINAELASARKWPGVIRSDIGVTRKKTQIPCLITADDLDYNTPKTRILIVGGLDGWPISVKASLQAMEWFYTADDAARFRKKFSVSAVPIVAPDAWATNTIGTNGSGGTTIRGYPPKGTAYGDPKSPEAIYLWRWIGTHVPDLVVVLESGSGVIPYFPSAGGKPLSKLGAALGATALRESDDLTSQLVRSQPAGIGSIPAFRLDAPNGARYLKQLLIAMQTSGFQAPSPARREMQRRLKRTPMEVATQLSEHYGHNLNSVAYIPALALIGRMRLGELTNDGGHLADVQKIVVPYFNGDQPTLGKRVGGSNLSGHLVFGELAHATGERRYVELAKIAADLGFDEQGHPKQAMPYHSEMSDAVFMGTPILTQVGRLTGEEKYHDMAVRHMRFMLKLNVRKDGLHRHSPLDETAWGRGNGFPALGLALALGDLPADHPGRNEMLRAFQSHVAALAKHQDPTGMWHQVIDHTGSYRELSCTSMITFALIRGVRNGWLNEDVYRPIINKGYNAVLARIAPDGTLIDVCTGTGKQKSLRAYLDRTAILGRDPRGGAMTLLLTTEMAAWNRPTD
jgi:rhamnogalacturonyl hydrolase YesR